MDTSAASALLRLQREMTEAQATFLAALERRDSAAMKASRERCAQLFERIKSAQQAAAAESTGSFTRSRSAQV